MRKFALWVLLSFAVLGVPLGGVFAVPNFLCNTVGSQACVGQATQVGASDFQPSATALENDVKISSVQEFVDFVENYNLTAGSENANVVLLADIDLSNVPLEDGAAGQTQQKVFSSTIGTEQKPFSGVFDGQGHTISNLRILTQTAESVKSFSGLFAYAENATIKNFVVENADISVSAGVNVFAGGAIGHAKNCKISGVGIGGTINFSVLGASTACVGGLAASAQECEILYVQNLGNTSLNSSLQTVLGQKANCALEFGALFGNVSDCLVFEGALSRGSLSAALALSDVLKTQYVGGVVGRISGSKLHFAVVQQQFDLLLEENFAGTLAVGGVAGVMNQGGSELKNVAIENLYSFAGAGLPQKAFVGEVVGIIQNQVPQAGNISFVHFKENLAGFAHAAGAVLDAFGDAGQYLPKNGAILGVQNQDFSKDQISSTTLSLSNLQLVGGKYVYFDSSAGNSLKWDPLLGPWNFDEVWRVGAGVSGNENMFLQNFYDLFYVRIAGISSSDVLAFDSDVFGQENEEDGQSSLYSSNFKYGDSVRLKFSFKKNSTSSGEIGESMSNYYSLVALSFTPSDATRQTVDYEIFTRFGTDGNTYGFNSIGQTHYSIQATDAGEGFEIVIDAISQATAGTYSITTTPKTKNIQITSKLFDEQGSFVEEIETDANGNVVSTPALISQSDTSRGEENLSLSLSYNRTRRVFTTVRPNKPFAFLGWFVLLKQDDGNLSAARQLNPPAEGQNPSQSLEILYGKNNFFATDVAQGYAAEQVDCIFAKYSISAYNLSFVLGEGVLHVDLFDGSVSVNESTATGQSGVAVSKNEPSLIMEIYVSGGVKFDTAMFISSFNTYNTSDDENFCQLIRSSTLDNNVQYFRFKFDMVKYKNNTSSQGNTIQVNVATTVVRTGLASWVWWLIAIGIALIMVLIVVIVVLFIRRRGGGFGGGFKSSSKVKTSKKSFKNKNTFY